MLTASEIQILSKNKTRLFSLRGELLWQSPLWDAAVEQSGENRQEAGTGWQEAGAGWQEHVAPDDIEYVMAWFMGQEPGEAGGHAVFRYLIPATRCWVCCIWSKERLRENWLVVGESIEVLGVPPLPGVAEAISEGESEPAETNPRPIIDKNEKTEGGGGGGGNFLF